MTMPCKVAEQLAFSTSGYMIKCHTHYFSNGFLKVSTHISVCETNSHGCKDMVLPENTQLTIRVEQFSKKEA